MKPINKKVKKKIITDNVTAYETTAEYLQNRVRNLVKRNMEQEVIIRSLSATVVQLEIDKVKNN